jgi:hypothetical protein
VQKSVLLAVLQQEIRRHDFSHFVPGCPACKKRINTMPQFLDHLANDAMPALLDRLSKEQA